MLHNPIPSYLTPVVIVTALFGATADPVWSQEGEGGEWVSTWSASPQPIWSGDFPLPTNLPFNLWDQTVRQTVRISLGGESFRIVMSNEYGNEPLVIDKVSVALSSGKGEIEPDTARPVTFSGQSSFRIPAGAPLVSDPVDLKVAELADLTISFHVSEPTPIQTFHWDGLATSYIAPGDQTENLQLTDAGPATTRIFLSDIFVEAEEGVRGIVAIGDSITDGAASGMDLNARWPDFLAQNLSGQDVAVVNAGISGARLLQSKMGENALARFNRDVLSKPNVDTVVLLMGINDISWPGQLFAPEDHLPTVEELKLALAQLASRARLNGVRLVVGTLTPFEDALRGSPLEGYYSQERDALRMELNDWIRTADIFDAVVDLEELVADPEDSRRILDEYQADHLHLSPAGNKIVADAFTLDVLFGQE